MSDHFQEQQLRRHVRGIYNYQVGQRGVLGAFVLIVGVLAAFVYFAATTLTMVSRIADGVRRLPPYAAAAPNATKAQRTPKVPTDARRAAHTEGDK